ncbi:hypothetical protein AB0Y20_01230 [Heyndrickxia oleronia]|uniref:hypothetical protein n=1 Tax=Heyndrickxia oleronia TaxID=38875 RepID=UPI003F208671
MLFELNKQQYNTTYDTIGELYSIKLITVNEKIQLMKLMEQLLYGNMSKANGMYENMNMYLHEQVERILNALNED